MKISVVIPAFNEEQRLEPSLRSIISYLKKNFEEYEIIVVDDCSDDRTGEIASRYARDNVVLLKNETNKGKGYSVKKGILHARYQYVLFTDSDLATPIEELKGFIPLIDDGYDVVIASRNLLQSDVRKKQAFYRHITGKAYPFFVNLLVLRGFRDTQCGFKLFNTKAAKEIAALQRLDGFSFDVEMLFIAKKLGCKIKETSVVWIDQKGSKVNIFIDGFFMLIDLLRIRYNDFLGRYDNAAARKLQGRS
jgi:dolichyl-phosphate beta-glucosyltransferase